MELPHVDRRAGRRHRAQRCQTAHIAGFTRPYLVSGAALASGQKRFSHFAGDFLNSTAIARIVVLPTFSPQWASTASSSDG
jgi:hypothetical protein